MNFGRHHVSLLAVATIATTALAAAPAQAVRDEPVAQPLVHPKSEPSIDTVKARVDALYTEAEKASEALNQAQGRLHSAQVRLAALRTDLAKQQQQVTALQNQVTQSVVSQYQGQSLSTASQVVFSPNPDAFLSKLSAVSAFDSQRATTVGQYGVALQVLNLRKGATDQQVAALHKLERQAAQDKATIDAKSAAAKKLLAHLQAKQLAAVTGQPASATAVTAAASAPASGRAGAAIQYAMAQVGKAYIWGGTGPSGYDCSGLTMMAWAQAGVGLPHSASAQQASGTPVSLSALQPGDLVFYGSPAYHVAMYIGNGQVVNAENPSAGIRVESTNFMTPSGATRVG